MPNEAFFYRNSKILGLNRQFRLINFGAFRVFLAGYQHLHLGTVSLLSMTINQPLFLQKTKPLYPNPKYHFGIGI